MKKFLLISFVICLSLVFTFNTLDFKNSDIQLQAQMRSLKATQSTYNCTSETTDICSNNGQCMADGRCECFVDYTDDDCSYHKKSKMTAFLLSFFLGMWGAERFYLGQVWQAVLKLLVTIAQCAICCAGKAFAKKENVLRTISLIVQVLASFGVFIWWLVDWILILTGELNGGHALRDDM